MKKRKIIFLIISFIVLFTTTILANRPANYKAMCFSTQRVLKEAIDLYNADYNPKINDFYPGRGYEEVEQLLVKKGYIKPLYLPTIECSYGGFNLASDTAVMFCKKHGTQESGRGYDDPPIIPTYDLSREIPFSEEYFQKQKKRLDDLASERKNRIFFNDYIEKPLMLLIIFSPIIFGIYIVIKLFVRLLGKVIKKKQ